MGPDSYRGRLGGGVTSQATAPTPVLAGAGTWVQERFPLSPDVPPKLGRKFQAVTADQEDRQLREGGDWAWFKAILCPRQVPGAWHCATVSGREGRRDLRASAARAAGGGGEGNVE